MKILVLDIDGVLNSAEYMRERRHLPRPTPHAIDAVTVPRLNAITDRTGAKIVVSSTWRLRKPEHDPSPVFRLQRILGHHGVTGDIFGVTPYLVDPAPRPEYPDAVKQRERGHEIQAWLDAWNEACAFGPGVPIDEDDIAILDDNSDMAHLRHRLVLTTWERGLLDEHVERVVAMLGEVAGG